MPQAKIAFEILEDGTISIKTDGVPGEHHSAADDLLSDVQKLSGGERATRSRGPKKYIHTHTHEHVHVNQGHKHD
jgi:hypothetical protein